MRAIKLPQSPIQKQWEYEQKRYDHAEAYCPMCDAWHENNTQCQQPTMGGEPV